MQIATNDGIELVRTAFEDGYRVGALEQAAKLEMSDSEKARRADKFGMAARHWRHGYDKARWDRFLRR